MNIKHYVHTGDTTEDKSNCLNFFKERFKFRISTKSPVSEFKSDEWYCVSANVLLLTEEKRPTNPGSNPDSWMFRAQVICLISETCVQVQRVCGHRRGFRSSCRSPCSGASWQGSCCRLFTRLQRAGQCCRSSRHTSRWPRSAACSHHTATDRGCMIIWLSLWDGVITWRSCTLCKGDAPSSSQRLGFALWSSSSLTTSRWPQ